MPFYPIDAWKLFGGIMLLDVAGVRFYANIHNTTDTTDTTDALDPLFLLLSYVFNPV